MERIAIDVLRRHTLESGKIGSTDLFAIKKLGLPRSAGSPSRAPFFFDLLVWKYREL
jgi:hypothetical protein